MSPQPGSLISAGLGSKIGEALLRLSGYLSTWQNSEGLYGGLIATWWSSTLETAVAHPMNQYPIILGFLELHKTGVGNMDWLTKARQAGDGLLSLVESDGSLKNSWGDIPGKTTGTVIFAGPALALSQLYLASGEDKYLKGAGKLLDYIDRNFSVMGRNFDGVTNQAFKWCEAMISYRRAAGDERFLKRANALGRVYLPEQIKKGPMAGAFYQGRSDDRLITVYVGKCITPLIRLYQETGSAQFLDAAVKASQYILRQESERGIFLNYHMPSGRCYQLAGRIPRFDYLIFRRRGAVHRLWHLFISGWRRVEYPSFIARSGDTLRGVWLTSAYAPGLRPEATRLVERFLGYQYQNGGFPNTVGFFTDSLRPHWQDVCCPIRWNAYAFLLLSTLCAEIDVCPPSSPGAAPERSSSEVSFTLDQDYLFTETREAVELRSPRGEVIALIRKPSGQVDLLADGWGGDLSGPRTGDRTNWYLAH
jgi:hypothetical protein